MERSIVSKVVKRGLYTRIIGRRILEYPKIDSTMNVAVEAAQEHTVEGTVVLADEQTSGRGRFDRLWVSHPGNLLLSVVFYPSAQELPYISLIASLAIVRAIERETKLLPVIKWPNDVIVRGKKIAGVLVENTLDGNSIRHSVVGIGVNIAMDTQKVPTIAPIATSLELEVGGEVNSANILRSLLVELDALYLQIRQGQSPVGQWRQYLDTLGKRVEVGAGGSPLMGTAENVDEMGHLLLRLDDGDLINLSAGEITVLSTG